MRNWIALPLTLALAACPGPTPSSPPTVTSTSPADKATNVARDTSISATFSENMVASSFAGSTFSISPAVAGSLATNGTSAKFTPTSPLAFGTTYAVTITTAAKGEAGGPLAANVTWSFTTIPETPVVVTTTPASGATEVLLNAAVSATFSRAMSSASITTASFTITPGVSGAVSYSGTTATFTPAAPLAFGTLYTANITTEAKDAGGMPLAANYSWSFTTMKDTVPTVSSTSPADNAGGVALNATMGATFSKPMLPASINTTSFTVTPGVSGSVSYSGTMATFTPGASLAFGTVYTATITTEAKDAAGTPLLASYRWSFTTITDPPPTVSSTSPANNATGVALNATIGATFSKPMLPASINTASFTVTPSVSGSVTYSGTTATFSPAAPLAFATVYTAAITTEAKDAAGTPLLASYSWSFTTVPQPGDPVAKAGTDQDVNRSTIVTLDGSGSSGAPGYPLTYAWTQVGGSQTLTGVHPTFTSPAEVGTVQFDLVVSDTLSTSLPSRVQINVMENKTNAVFVTTGGQDSAAGTRAAPMLTIQAAINKAASSGSAVYLGGGNYRESLTLVTGVSIYGGFDSATWVRNPLSSVTSVLGGTRVIQGIGVSGLTVNGLSVVSATATAPGDSSYGFFLVSSTGIKVTNNHIAVGAGAAGGRGFSGPGGSNGARGNGGSTGCDGDCPSNTVVIRGGAGGGAGVGNAGGTGGSGHFEAAGDVGAVGVGSFGGSGGFGGSYTTGQSGGAGGSGGNAIAAGAAGTNGPPGADSGGTASANGYVPADGSAGGAGGDGSGGGGGGAGGGYCVNSIGCSGGAGNGGGGGGQGGFGGGAGSGGRGGGGSFGIYFYQSTGETIPNVIAVGAKGAGGAGGAGGPGGSGGFGGFGGAFPAGTPAASDMGPGGSGGRGSNGGTGGTGGVGGAGPSVAVYP